MHTHSCVYTHIHMQMNTHSRTHTRTLTRAHTHARTHTLTLALTHSHTLTHSRTRSHTHTHTHAHTRSHTHTPCSLLFSDFPHLLLHKMVPFSPELSSSETPSEKPRSTPSPFPRLGESPVLYPGVLVCILVGRRAVKTRRPPLGQSFVHPGGQTMDGQVSIPW